MTNTIWYDILLTMMNTDKHTTTVSEYAKVLEMVRSCNKTNCKTNILYKLGILKNSRQLQVKTGRVDVERNRVSFRIDMLYKKKICGYGVIDSM